MFKGKKVLVTGSEGMIGRELVKQLEKLDADVTGVDYFIGQDLRDMKQCMFWCGKTDYVFHLAGIKGNPRKTSQKPVDFMANMLQFDTNMIVAAQMNEIKRFLYTSSIAVENIDTDFYPAWAKLTAEHLIEAMRIQYPRGTKYCIVRPSNVYGRFDNLESLEPMVITSLIKKALLSKKDFSVWGDGSQIRDFINARDVARGMIKAMEDMPKKPVNLCSGTGVKIKEIVRIIEDETNKRAKYDTKKPTGAKRRVMKLNWDFKPEISIKEGLREIIREWKNVL